jgi:hypothetical protein
MVVGSSPCLLGINTSMNMMPSSILLITVLTSPFGELQLALLF